MRSEERRLADYHGHVLRQAATRLGPEWTADRTSVSADGAGTFRLSVFKPLGTSRGGTVTTLRGGPLNNLAILPLCPSPAAVAWNVASLTSDPPCEQPSSARWNVASDELVVTATPSSPPRLAKELQASGFEPAAASTWHATWTAWREGLAEALFGQIATTGKNELPCNPPLLPQRVEALNAAVRSTAQNLRAWPDCPRIQRSARHAESRAAWFRDLCRTHISPPYWDRQN